MTICLGRAVYSVYRVVRERLSVCFFCATFPVGSEGGMWDLILLLPDHFLSFTLNGDRKCLLYFIYALDLLYAG